MVKSHEDPYYESIYLSKEDSFYLSAFVLSKKKIYRLVKAFFRTDGVPLPAHLFLRVVERVFLRAIYRNLLASKTRSFCQNN
jgi:hypothetical protein